MRGTPDYEPPESVGPTSRPHDVWSLGCVFLEILVWALWNSKETSSFFDARLGPRDLRDQGHSDAAFWQRNHDGDFELRRVVMSRLRELTTRMQQTDATAFRTVKGLDTVIDDMLQLLPVNRLRAFDVKREIKKIVKQYKVDMNKDASRTPETAEIVAQVSLEPPEHRSPTVGQLTSPTTGNPTATYAEVLSVSPLDIPSPRWDRGQQSLNVSGKELTPSVASRSRNTSNASSTLSIRGEKSKEKKHDASKSPDNKR